MPTAQKQSSPSQLGGGGGNGGGGGGGGGSPEQVLNVYVSSFQVQSLGSK